MLAVHSVRRLVESLVEPMAEQKAATRGEQWAAMSAGRMAGPTVVLSAALMADSMAGQLER